MTNHLISIVVVFILCVFVYPSQGEGNSKVKVISKDINYLKFLVSLSNGLLINNIVFRKEPILNKWLLQFRKNNGLMISRSGEDSITCEHKMNVDEYGEVLDEALSLIKREFLGSSIDQIQFDLDLVGDTWNKVVISTKDEAKRMSGLVSQKRENIHRAVVYSLIQSEQMTKSCSILKKYSFECDENVISINPIAFKNEYLNKKWSSIVNISDAGLRDNMWFGIKIQ